MLRPAGLRQAVNSVSPCYWHLRADLLTTLTWTGSKPSRNAAEQGVCGECSHGGHSISLWQKENLGRRESVETITEDGALGVSQLS